MATSQELTQFKKLKKLVVDKFRESHPNVPQDPTSWSGQDITWFQEDLQEKVNTGISEKWFYTYFKQGSIEKLPRIDMLNLLSVYIGEKDWTSFQSQNQLVSSASKSGIKYLIAGVILGVLLLGFYLMPKEKNFTFCFVDKDVNLPITSTLQISIIKEGQSPIQIQSQENGCFTHAIKGNKIQFVVESPYYQSDTFTRYFREKGEVEEVQLKANEYALILHYFSTNNVEDWNQRRVELSKMISDNAAIYQVFGEEEFGIDVLSKEAFINKITLPTSSLRNMKILEIKREAGQISKLKFAIKTTYE